MWLGTSKVVEPVFKSNLSTGLIVSDALKNNFKSLVNTMLVEISSVILNTFLPLTILSISCLSKHLDLPTLVCPSTTVKQPIAGVTPSKSKAWIPLDKKIPFSLRCFIISINSNALNLESSTASELPLVADCDIKFRIKALAVL